MFLQSIPTPLCGKGESFSQLFVQAIFLRASGFLMGVCSLPQRLSFSKQQALVLVFAFSLTEPGSSGDMENPPLAPPLKTEKSDQTIAQNVVNLKDVLKSMGSRQGRAMPELVKPNLEWSVELTTFFPESQQKKPVSVSEFQSRSGDLSLDFEVLDRDFGD